MSFALVIVAQFLSIALQLAQPSTATALMAGSGGASATLQAMRSSALANMNSNSFMIMPGSLPSIRGTRGQANINQNSIRMSHSADVSAGLHSAIVPSGQPLNGAAPIILSGWQELTSHTETEDCYAELNQQIKDQLNKLDELRRSMTAEGKSVGKGALNALMGNLNQDQDSAQEGDDDIATKGMRQIIDSHLQHLNRDLVGQLCPSLDAPLALQSTATSSPFGSNWLPVDPANFDYVYTTLKRYKSMLDTIVSTLGTSFGKKTVGEVVKDLRERPEAVFEAAEKMRAGLLNGAMKIMMGDAKFKVKTYLQEMVGNFIFDRSAAPTGSLGIFSPIIDMIGSSDARLAAKYLLDPILRNSLDTINREEPIQFLKCADQDKIQDSQC